MKTILAGLPAETRHGSRPARVGIVTPDIAGPIRNGGIGTAYAALARELAAAGQDVTIGYTLGTHTEGTAIEGWIDRYRTDRVTLEPIVAEPQAPPILGPTAAFHAYRWAAAQSFDVLHFPEWGGVGFCIAQAKRLGLAFQETLLCAGLHSPSLWHDLENGRAVTDIDQLARDYLERRSVEAADVVISPSHYLLDWVTGWEWRLPSRAHVQPNIFSPGSLGIQAQSVGGERVEAVVFFGRLEQRKGLELFCDAIDLLVDRGRTIQVGFLGKAGMVQSVDGATYARARSARWPVPTTIESGFSREAALSYLRDRRALAVMPSLADNSPGTVLECLTVGIPFVACRTGGIPEMIAESDRDLALCAPEPSALAALLERRLNQGAGSIQPAHDPETVRRQWIAWHQAQVPLDPLPRPTARTEPAAGNSPLVSICIATFNRPALLEQALASIRAQDYRPFEVILVDDGSDDPVAQSFLDALRAEFDDRGWKIVRTDRRFPGAARNAAAKEASGDFLFFMDDDNVAMPHEVRRLVDAALHSNAQLVTCAHDAFRGDAMPSAQNVVHRWLPLGPALPLAWFVNCVGDTNMLIARQVFADLGGFVEEPRAGAFEDWALLVKAIERGVRVELLPESLYFYRLGPQGYGQQSPMAQFWDRPLRSLAETRPAEVRLALAYAVGRTHATGEHVQRTPAKQSDLPPVVKRRIRDVAHGLVVAALADRSGGHEHGSHLGEAFVAGMPIASAGPSPWRLTAIQELTLADVAGGLQMSSSGDEPQARLDLTLDGRGPWLVRLDITAPARTELQLFWKTIRLPVYCEAQSVRAPLDAGRNVRFLRIAAPRLWGRLRLDPGAVAGDFILHALEIRRASRH